MQNKERLKRDLVNERKKNKQRKLKSKTRQKQKSYMKKRDRKGNK